MYVCIVRVLKRLEPYARHVAVALCGLYMYVMVGGEAGRVM